MSILPNFLTPKAATMPPGDDEGAHDRNALLILTEEVAAAAGETERPPTDAAITPAPTTELRILHLDGEEFFCRGFRQALGCYLETELPPGDGGLGAIKSEIMSVSTLAAAENILAAGPKIDLMVVEMRLLSKNLFEALRAWRLGYPGMKLVILSSTEQRSLILTALDAGIHGFIAKNGTAQEICAAMGSVLAGQIFIPKNFAEVADSFAKMAIYDAHEPREAAAKDWLDLPPQSSPDEQLSPGAARQMREKLGQSASLPDHYAEQPHNFAQITPKQRDILLRLIAGQTSEMIAKELGLADATIAVHMSAIMRFLGARQETHQEAPQDYGPGQTPRPNDGSGLDFFPNSG
ncbi:MAG: response regulator transcription factor [Candidatus Symbiobacter sp.]|nr:response regulator transcription factor [Candidatus Symbiobacter sp.]